MTHIGIERLTSIDWFISSWVTDMIHSDYSDRVSMREAAMPTFSFLRLSPAHSTWRSSSLIRTNADDSKEEKDRSLEAFFLSFSTRYIKSTSKIKLRHSFLATRLLFKQNNSRHASWSTRSDHCRRTSFEGSRSRRGERCLRRDLSRQEVQTTNNDYLQFEQSHLEWTIQLQSPERRWHHSFRCLRCWYRWTRFHR